MIPLELSMLQNVQITYFFSKKIKSTFTKMVAPKSYLVFKFSHIVGNSEEGTFKSL
jgi:hypothetical protein